MQRVHERLAQRCDQIEYTDQDQRIHRIWLEEMKKNGVEPKMEKYFPQAERMPVMAK